MLALFEHDTSEQIYFCTLLPHMPIWVFLVAKITENFVIALPLFANATAAIRTLKASVVDLFSTIEKKGSAIDLRNEHSNNAEESVKDSILHYYTYILGEIYSTIFFTIVAPTLYFGPNQSWYEFSFTATELFNSIALQCVCLSFYILNLTLGFRYVKRKFGINLLQIGSNLYNNKEVRSFMTAVCWVIPVFVFTQLGRQWSVVWYVDNVIVPNLTKGI
ncbi:hypothetical protein BKA69DRAFT_1124653 [Paraphysoderma sedebokerense]|nr:hypothetical protein BKA69DRAFT_1124653 [Paraphysoderma sedebokerense]